MDLVRRVGLSPNVRKKNIPLKGRIFGVPLLELTKKCDNNVRVPNIVLQCADYIRLHGFQEEGLFRVSGNRRVIDQLRTEYDQSGTANLGMVHDVSVVTSVFKMFFRELPEPLIPDEVSQEILKITEDRSLCNSDLVDSIRARCGCLPSENFNLLKFLCAFLHEVGQKVADTKMTDSSLAIVFGPNLFRIENDLEALQRQPTITKAMSCLITHHQQIFSDGKGTNNKAVPPASGLIKVGSVPPTQTSPPCFILPQVTSPDKENVVASTLDNNKAKDWDDTWLSGLAQDSPSPETEDILARSHDSLSSMSPLTGSANLSIQFNLQQTIKECIYEMMIPAPSNSDHSFNIYNNRNNDSSNLNGKDAVRRKGPKSDYHSNRNNVILDDKPGGNNYSDSLMSLQHNPLSNKQTPHEIFNFTNCQPLSSLTKGRASPQKRKQVSKSPVHPSPELTQEEEVIVPKLNLFKLSKAGSASSLNNQSDNSNLNSSPKTSPKTSTSSSNSIASLNRKITLLKQQVATFDSNFQKVHDRPPVGNERRPIAGTVKELNELKRQLFDAKAVESSKASAPLSCQYSMISSKMDEKRKLACRPNDLKDMTHAQLTDEKLCIQKLLLHFEETYGRPKSKDQKDMMRPIYDRYRKVKIALNTVMESGPSEDDKTPRGGRPNAQQNEHVTRLNDTWNLTLGNTSAASGVELMNLTPEQLLIRMEELHECKRDLRKSLRDYEKSFLSMHGRKVLKEDRGPRESEYNEYKKVKAKIRLGETILKKSDCARSH